jgi:hypothetical protein
MVRAANLSFETPIPIIASTSINQRDLVSLICGGGDWNSMFATHRMRRQLRTMRQREGGSATVQTLPSPSPLVCLCMLRAC